MELLNLKQGTDEWLEARLNHLTASEAPAMMGHSKFMTRNQLLDLKKGWQSAPDSSFKKRLFEKGHVSEAAARELIEMDLCDELPPVVGKINVGSLELLASFDGYSETAGIWEHKDWNKVLAENVSNDVLEPQYFWQLEHQALVAGQDKVMFSVSDGTTDNREFMIYFSEPDRRQTLIAGWKQFLTDLECHQIKAKTEVIEAVKISLPVIQVSIKGSAISTNIQSCLLDLKILAQNEMSKVLDSDQDFADKEQLNKDVKKTRFALKEIVADVEGKFVSYAEFASVAKEMDSVLKKMQSHGEKHVKQSKEAKKAAYAAQANNELLEHIKECNGKISPLTIYSIVGDLKPEFLGAMKGKRNIDSLINAVSEELTKWKVYINQVMDRVQPNIEYMNANTGEYRFLFNDAQQIVNMEAEGFRAVVKSRINDHKQAENKRLEAERERIRQEEERKAQAKAARLAEQERARIAQEERQKLEAEHKALRLAEAEQRRIAQEERDRLNAEYEAQQQVQPEEYHPMVCARELTSNAPIEHLPMATKPIDTMSSYAGAGVEPSAKHQMNDGYSPLSIWPRDQDRAESEGLDRVCIKLEEAEDYIEYLLNTYEINKAG